MTVPTESSAVFPPSVVSVQSRYDFLATVSRLKETLATRGVTLFADIDQSDAASRTGLSLRPTRLFLFGNPKAGTPIMAANPHAAMELPLRAVVWEDDRQRVFVDYQDVTRSLVHYNVDSQLFAPLQQMPALLRAVAGQD